MRVIEDWRFVKRVHHWGMRFATDADQEPDCWDYAIQGILAGDTVAGECGEIHPGQDIVTSAIITFGGDHIITLSGSYYRLGTPAENQQVKYA